MPMHANIKMFTFHPDLALILSYMYCNGWFWLTSSSFLFHPKEISPERGNRHHSIIDGKDVDLLTPAS